MTAPASPAAQPLRLAVIGAGPAGVYAAETLMRTERVKSGDLQVQCDLFDALPTPFGLIRYGVAPDHPRIKGIITALHRILGRGDIRFLGNVDFGTDLTLADLQERYDAVIFATGALKDAPLDIPGIDLEGSYGAADFVAWYDGNPDYPRTWPLTARSVAMIGNGNVALDAARMLVKSSDELLRTEIPANVEEGLAAAATEDVHVFGRRGPAQTKFTPLETRELSHPRGVQIVMDPRDFEAITPEIREEIRADKRTDQVYSTFETWLAEQTEREASGAEPTDAHGGPVRRRLHLHFWHRPVEVLGEDGRVVGVRFERTRPTVGGAVEGTGEMHDYEVQAVYRAIGYLGSELPGVPFDERRGVVLNDGGRVVTADGGAGITPERDAQGAPIEDDSPAVIPGLYANGWIKRGPVGLIGATKSDAQETIANLLEDMDAGMMPAAADRDPDSILRLLAERDVEVTTWDGWMALEEHEIALGSDATDADGAPRPRIKVVEREDMMRVAREGAATAQAVVQG